MLVHPLNVYCGRGVAKPRHAHTKESIGIPGECMMNEKETGKPAHRLIYRILEHPVNERESILDKLFQAFFKVLGVVAATIGVVARRKQP
jgi:hypothetical protein